MVVGEVLPAADYYVVPYKTDPPIQVDGRLDDWANVPNPLVLSRKEQVTYSPEGWTGPDDLSGVVRLAWREGGLYVAAEVTDSVVNQPYRAGDIWKGDHLNLWVDLIPGQEAERTMFGRGQFHVVVSPGNLGGVSGTEKVTAPEIHVYRPEGLPKEGGEVAARRTDKGYVLEAFIPWTRLGATPVKMSQDANFEVAFSDADGSPARQEKLMTSDTRPWHYSRLRVLPCVFGDGNGRGAAPVRAVPIAAALDVPAQDAKTATFTAPTVPADKVPYLYFKARLQAPGVAGVKDRALAVELNGQRLPGERVSNRNPVSRLSMGPLQTFVWPDGALGVYCTADFALPQRSNDYMLLDYGPGCEYEFSLDGLLEPGENAVRFVSLAADTPEQKAAVSIGEVALRVKARVPPRPAPTAAPTGELPVAMPQLEFPPTWAELKSDGTTLAFTVSGERVEVQSRFSAPDGMWHTGSSPVYEHSRRVVEHPEYLEDVEQEQPALHQKALTTDPAFAQAPDAARRFICWLQQGLSDGTLRVNQADALVHFVDEGMLLVSPRIFREFAKNFGEVGAALGASEDAAKMRVNRALEKLRKMFSKRGVTLTAEAIAGAVSAYSVQAAGELRFQLL